MGKKQMSTNNQKARIHILKNQIPLRDEEYRHILGYNWKVESSKDLTKSQAYECIRALEAMLSLGDYVEVVNSGNQTKFNEWGGRPGMATPQQLRLIDVLWSQVTRAETPEQHDSTLRKFLENRFGISHLKFIEIDEVYRIVHALKKMQKQKHQKEAAQSEKAEGDAD